MQLKKGTAPYYRRQESVRDIMLDMVIALLFLLIIPTVNHGPRVLVLAGICMATCVVSELMFDLFCNREIMIGDASSLVTGLIIAMLLPANVPFRAAFIACAFAVIFVKMPFGGVGKSPFNPAAAGIAFVTLAFPKEIFTYRDPLSAQSMEPFSRTVDVQTALSPAALLKIGARPSIMPDEMLFGRFAGPMGTTAILVIAACAVFLLFRRTVRWENMISFVGTVMLFAALFPRLETGRVDSVMFEMMSGSIAFCAVFMLSEPGTSPKLPFARCLYGMFCGVLTMLFRYFGAFEQGVCFAILLANAIGPLLDKWTWRLMERGGVNRA